MLTPATLLRFLPVRRLDILATPNIRLGSPGEPGGYENAERVLGDVYHVPQFLPGYPTSATLWPRVIDVPCTRAAGGEIQCQGYQWLPKYGRAEYLFFRPVLVAGPTAEAPSPEEAPVASGPLPAKPDRH